ncbi:hypothetical protein OAV45_04465 [Candidatus Poseidoniales archaeon]|jgi:hypothetical protein|nr:hypothetical protein [Candidatus Poseidoniales archaeon]|tara:strand:- start:3290 stop:3481 length:192 start_codon:yes stop_codon:yes gene_type:complete
MAPIWPFKKKSLETAKASTLEASKVVEYERPDKIDENIEKDRSHLTNKNFVDAMALLSEDINE